MKKIFFALLVTFVSFSAFAQQTNKLVTDYIGIKNALVNGDSKAASQSLTTFQQGLKNTGDFSGKEELVKATDNMAKAGGLEKQRAAFNDVSTSLWAAVKSDAKSDTPVYYQYCPMKKAYWISESQAIKNPYYGASMLSCGKVVETK